MADSVFPCAPTATSSLASGIEVTSARRRKKGAFADIGMLSQRTREGAGVLSGHRLPDWREASLLVVAPPGFMQLAAVLPRGPIEPAPAGSEKAALVRKTEQVGRLR